MRLDLYLVSSGLAASRQKAAFLIKNGDVLVNGCEERKPSAEVFGKTVTLCGEGLRYVSRGGLKLEEALKVFSLDAGDLVCLDLGASTGGFTDCLLQNGAKRVYALDVGTGQLDAKLREDARVFPIEGFNARELCEDSLPEKVDLAVSDLSFISQRLIYAPLVSVLKENAPFVSLIKPQFEAGKKSLLKKGILNDRREHIRVIGELIACAEENGLHMQSVCPSPIRGKDGNREYLALFIYGGKTAVCAQDVAKAVYDRL